MKRNLDPIDVLAFILNPEKNEAEKTALFSDYTAAVIKATRKATKTVRNAYTHPHKGRESVQYSHFIATIANNADAIKYDLDNLMKILEQLKEIPRSTHNKLLILSIESMLRSVNAFKSKYPYQSQQAISKQQ